VVPLTTPFIILDFALIFLNRVARQLRAKLLFCQGYHTLVKNAQFQGVKYLPPPNMKAQRGSKDIALLSLFFYRARCYRTLFKDPTHALCFKIHINTQSLFKALECLRLLCHPTCFGHTLDHLQGMFLVQCYFPPCCFVL